MENQYQSPFHGPKSPIPNATTVLVLGICSIVFSCLFVGVVLGIIGLVMASKGRAMYKEAPAMYSNYSQLNAGWIMSIIGTVLGGLYLIYYIIIVAIIGSSAWSFSHLSN